ncbi:MAG TPA: branched-chain amino acid ABC transporter substrate-binding protein [Noviherbaspirillum sp.]|uniref:branched-chain amino acid ABC transporter substrate-binding protein n=1 Tax=Noviherbaspirillum sp. TaxID=1926288 RepID=UPI002B47913D|nr:branched-chain amino acid ABC transporter substrate-binding protein [Noviherbaspirillum sp.]HJV87761.1 branched-chain amino acid ABC transporter substrate-binding protein [Noviherbaspirillum sp.]
MSTMSRPVKLALAAAALVSSHAAQAENIRIAYIDPLSGAFAATGVNVLKSWQMVADIANREKWAGDNTFEVVGFDNKASPQETLVALKSAIDQGFHYVAQGFGSGAGLALIDAINKHNERNPGKEVVYLNTSAGDPDMTNSKCSFWHFRLDAHAEMRMEALTSYMQPDKNIKKVYIINPNYAFGQQVQRVARENLKRKRPDIQIVGDDLHPFGQVKDFTPYIAKIAASGADSVITGDAGSDLALLIKAAKEANLNANFYTYFASSSGVPASIGSAGADRVKALPYWHPNNETFAGKEIVEAFKKKYNDDFFSSATYAGIELLSTAIKQTKSTNPVKVAYAMEGMKVKSLNGEVEMRKTDHQLQQPLYMVTWVKTNGKDVKFDAENTGYGWRTDRKIDTYVATLPTSCQMKRPPVPGDH